MILDKYQIHILDLINSLPAPKQLLILSYLKQITYKQILLAITNITVQGDYNS